MNKFSYYMLCVWTIVALGRPQDIFQVLVPLHIGDISAGLAMVTYFLGSNKSDENVLSFPEFRLFLIFCIIATLCIPFGYYPRKGLYFIWAFFVKFGIYIYLFSKLINDKDRFNGMINTLVACGLIMASAAIFSMTTEGRLHVIGSAYDPNDLALLVVTTLPIAITRGLSTRKTGWKLICFGGSGLFVITLVGTQSRGGFLGLMAATVAFFLTKTPGFSKRKLFFVFVGLAIVFGAYVGVEYKERLSTILEDVSDVRAGSGRILVWKRAVTIAGDNPILGVGPGGFGTAYGDYLSKGKFTGEAAVTEDLHAPYAWKAIHNSFLQVLVELGIPGLLVFIAIISRSFRNLLKVENLGQKIRTDVGLSATGLKIGFISFLTSAFFLTHGYSVYIYIILFLSGAMVRFYEKAYLLEKANSHNSHVHVTV